MPIIFFINIKDTQAPTPALTSYVLVNFNCQFDT